MSVDGHENQLKFKRTFILFIQKCFLLSTTISKIFSVHMSVTEENRWFRIFIKIISSKYRSKQTINPQSKFNFVCHLSQTNNNREYLNFGSSLKELQEVCILLVMKYFGIFVIRNKKCK
ncbi:hypothetical protein AHAS_Ahas20G0221000 [Arachis hypogaea]